MNRVGLLVLPICLLCAVGTLPLAAQGAYLDKGVNGFGLEARAAFADGGVGSVGLTAGYSIAGVLDVGANVSAALDELGGYDATDVRVGFDYRLNVIKQSPGVPLSLQVAGSYGFNNVLSEYLDNDGATRRATGYAIGLNLASNVRVVPWGLIRVHALGDWASTLYTTVGGPLDGTERVSELQFGGGLGFLFVFGRGATLAVLAEVRANQDLDTEIRPIVSVAFPRL